jgi:inner membrane transporter RhtA
VTARAIALCLAAGCSVQAGAAFAVTLFDRLGPGGAVFLRVAFGTAVLLAVFRPAVRGRSARDLRLVLGFGLVLGLMNWTFYESLERIPLGACVTLEMIGPLGVGVLGSRRPRDLVWVLLAAVGVVIIADPFGTPLDIGGVVLAFTAGLFWGAYILLSARVGQVFPGASGLALAMVVATAVVAPAGIVQGGAALLEPELLAAGALVGVMCSVIPYSLEMEALRTLPEGVFGVLMALEPGLAALAGVVIIGQGLAATDLLAIALVVAASAGAAATIRRPAAVAAVPPVP